MLRCISSSRMIQHVTITDKGIRHLQLRYTSNAILRAFCKPLNQKKVNIPPCQLSRQFQQNHRMSSTKRPYPTQVFRSPTIIELLKSFPSGVMKLYDEIQTSLHIQATAHTPINAWTKRGSHVPRRQLEQQRQLHRDLQKVIVPVAIGALPAIGNVFLVAMAMAPRFFLSWHFFSEDQYRYFVSLEYRDKKQGLQLAGDAVLNSIGLGRAEINVAWNSLQTSNNNNDVDRAGPIFKDVLPLYDLTPGTSVKKSYGKLDLFQSKILNVSSNIKRDQLVLLARARLPSPMVSILPSVWIRMQFKSLVNDIVQDDMVLLKEKQHINQCSFLTNKEVLEACLLRGLPCGLDVNFEEMRACLANHLVMMKQILENHGRKGIESDKAALFILQFPAIRYAMKEYNKLQ